MISWFRQHFRSCLRAAAVAGLIRYAPFILPQIRVNEASGRNEISLVRTITETFSPSSAASAAALEVTNLRVVLGRTAASLDAMASGFQFSASSDIPC